MPPELLQFLGSLIAILALTALAWWLRLGPQAKLENEDQARIAAAEAIDGFEPQRIALDTQGMGALLQDRDGRILLLRPHGSHIAGRLLTPAASAREESGSLVVNTGEKRFGTCHMEIIDGPAWVKRIEAIV